MTSLSMELQVWYGILFKPATALDPECPPLPDIARRTLDSQGAAAVTRYLVKCGYTGPEELTWLCYEQPKTSYWAVAAGASVQRSTRSVSKVNTTFPDDVALRWLNSLAQVAQIMGLPSGTAIDWYQTCSYELASPRP